MAPLVMVSNRGPLSFGRDPAGRLVRRGGGGGLVSSLRPLLAGSGATWVSAAMSEGDRAAAASGLMEMEGVSLRTVDVDPATYARAYNVVANATLWFLHHGLFDLGRQPRFDRHWAEAWEAYQATNRAFSDVVAREAPEGAAVLVQDYHLCLVGRRLAAERPDLRVVHFSHTPFADPWAIRVLPTAVAAELLEGMSAAVACGFHAGRWAEAFEACCDEVLGSTPATFVSPLGPDEAQLRRAAAGADGEASAWVEELAGERLLIARVDRMEPSKNLLRGFLAFEELLASFPGWRRRVVFLALAYPSREALAQYRSYRTEVETLVERINRRWGEPGWTPIVLETRDDYARSLAALGRYDVLLVNPVRDGLNLVAKEGPLLNRRDGALVLSREAGAWPELAAGAVEVNPFDVVGTAEALDTALSLRPGERAGRAEYLREAAGSHDPGSWLEDQLAAAEG